MHLLLPNVISPAVVVYKDKLSELVICSILFDVVIELVDVPNCKGNSYFPIEVDPGSQQYLNLMHLLPPNVISPVS
jgi:hypothetical protein